MDFGQALQLIQAPPAPALLPELLHTLLTPPDEAAEKALFAAAYAVKLHHIGNGVSLRGLIEISNICTRDCLYCGIRKSNAKMGRYAMSTREVVEYAALAGKFGYGSVVLQSGERSDPEFVEWVAELLRQIRQLPGELGITLSCGEQTLETYRYWRSCGASRYLLRIESSDEKVYTRLHPIVNGTFASRCAALRDLRLAGYQVGTGVMIGLPETDISNLVNDLLFFQQTDPDMIGMGPFIPQPDTPLGMAFPEKPGDNERGLTLALRMIAVTRLLLKDVNIAATTALQALDPENGRQRGLLAGANVIMPNVGSVDYRKDYQLYNGKPDLNENADDIRAALTASLLAIGEYPRLNEHGDSPRFAKRSIPR